MSSVRGCGQSTKEWKNCRIDGDGKGNRHEKEDAYLKPKSRAGMIFTRANIMKE